MYLQHHWGVYRSDDGGSNWIDIGQGLPSDFGFALVAHPHHADTCYVVPLASDMNRWFPGGRMAVYRTRDAGSTWAELGKGLPEKDTYHVVLRDCLAIDDRNPAGLYVGTTAGQVYVSSDEGDSWQLLSDGLPVILGVSVGVVR